MRFKGVHDFIGVKISQGGFYKKQILATKFSKRNNKNVYLFLMKKNTLRLFFCLLFISFKIFAQPNVFSGTWQMDYLPGPGMPPIYMELQIAAPERNQLFPAHLKLQCNNFSAEYDLLLVKKSSRELAISKNKFPVSEQPFSLGDGLFFLNGILDLSRNLKGMLNLHVIRIQSAQNGISIPDSIHFEKTQKATGINLLSFLKDTDIRLIKFSDTTWKGGNSDRILTPALSPAYFGLQDTIHVTSRDGILNLNSNKKNDIVSLTLNGNTFIDMLMFAKKPHLEELVLDTGLNVLVMFAENFGNQIPNKASLALDIANKKINLDFTTKADSAASFIVAKIYCDPDKAKDIYFKKYPTIPGERLQPNDKLIGSITATSQQVKLAIWDDAVEDGDSISININGQWIARGLPIKKIPKFITVTLKPGPNIINFVADNLGSIPPNTSVLEIIDGNKRKSYTLEANLGENNLVKIFYDVERN